MSVPMREPTFFILASLMRGPLHGYGIIKQAAEISEGRVHLTAGTLYGALERLESQGLVAAQGEEVVDGRARRYYRLTGPGERALAAEADRMQQAAGVVRTGLIALRGSPA
jgi:DNA-binding PadR family transcriptional regulator